jgi:hypothetical protein
MNTAEFNTELAKLFARAIQDGLARGKMTPIDIVGTIELQKADLVRNLQDAVRANQQPAIFIPKRPFTPL